MYTMHEALARERMQEVARRAQSARSARELAAERRRHRVSRYAWTARARRATRLRELTAQ